MHEFSQEVLPRPSEPADLIARQACQTEKAGSRVGAWRKSAGGTLPGPGVGHTNPRVLEEQQYFG